MRRIIVFILASVTTGICCITSCVHKPQQPAPAPSDGNYPADVAKILLSKCAVSGCHNEASYQNSAGLLLDTWEHLFNGSIYGAEIVAYSTKYSTLLYYTNVNKYDTTETTVDDPHHFQPYSPPTKDEYLILKNWIAKGAPDKNGRIPFADGPDTRQKIYLTQQGCSNVVTVIDARSKLIMRIIPVGGPNDKTPHGIVVSEDGMYAYVSLFDGHMVQKIDTRIDTIIASVNLGTVVPGGVIGGWSIIDLSPLDTSFLVTGFMPTTGSVTAVNTASMQINPKMSIDYIHGGSSLFPSPHGIAANATFDTFFATLQYGNSMIRYTFKGGFHYKLVSVDGNTPGSTDTSDHTSPNPHQIVMAPDHSKYFVSCQGTGSVNVIDAHKDTVIAKISVGAFPQEMTISTSKNSLFVACMEDKATPVADARGSVYAIDMNSLAATAIYGDFYEPHDMTVDEQDGLLYISNRNVSPDGPAPHHTTTCNGRPGWYSVYDLNTLNPVDNKRYTTPVDPYAIAPRFRTP